MTQFRVPVAGPYTSRVSSVNAPDSASGKVGIGIVGLMIVGGGQARDKDARYINCFAHTVPDPIAGIKRVFTVKRPGFATLHTPSAGDSGSAIFVWTGSSNEVISAFGATNSRMFSSTVSIGVITGVATGITETVVGTDPVLTITSTDSTAWRYDTSLGTVTKITDGDYPGNAGETVVGGMSHMDGFPFVMTASGKLYAGDLNSVAAWTANSFGSTNAYPDKGVGCIRFRNFIMAFNQNSVEFWYNAGLTPFPLARANAMTVKVGCIHARALAQISDTIFWAGSTPEGGLSIFQYDGNLSRISTPEVDWAIILAGTTNVSLTTLRFFGLSFVLVKASTFTYAYCIEEKMWHEWSSQVPLWFKCASTSIAGTMVNYAVSNISSLGAVFVMNHTALVYTDNSVPYTALAQLPKMDHGTMRKKRWADVELVCDRELSASAITLSYSDDDYQNFNSAMDRDLSNNRVRWTRLGSSRRRAWAISHSAATPMRIEALEGNMEIGAT